MLYTYVNDERKILVPSAIKESYISSNDIYILLKNGSLVGSIGGAFSKNPIEMLLKNVTKISKAYNTIASIDKNNDLYTCGSGLHGCLGTGNTSSIKYFTKVAENVKDVYMSDNYITCYIATNGDLYVCGLNDNYQLGIPNSTGDDVMEFTKVAEHVKYVTNYSKVSLYISEDNELYLCGSNQFGQQGVGTLDITEVKAFTKRAENVKSAGCYNNNVWYINEDDELYACGLNSSSQLSGTGNKLSFEKIAENVKKFICGGDYSFYISNDNELYGVGTNSKGLLGYGSLSQRIQNFTKIAENVKNIYTSYNNTNVSAYINEDSELYVTGKNTYGQLGTGDTTDVVNFIKIADNVKEFIGIDWIYTSSYITNNGELYLCGRNNMGQQGTGNTSDVLSFRKIDDNVITNVHLNASSNISGAMYGYIKDYELYKSGYFANSHISTSSNEKNSLTFVKRYPVQYSPIVKTNS